MTGLLRNNFYAACSNAKAFAILLFLFGLFVVAVDNKPTTLVLVYTLLSMIGFTDIVLESLYRKNAGKWKNYQLTLPVKRAEIVQSQYISELLWLLVGVLFSAVVVTLSILLHGFPFFRSIDVFILFILGISISLLWSAIFFLLFYWGGEEKADAFRIVSLLLSGIITACLITLINILLGTDAAVSLLLLGAFLLLAFSVLMFFISYPLTVFVFKHKEY